MIGKALLICLLLTSCAGNKAIIIGIGVVECSNNGYVETIGVDSLGVNMLIGDISHLAIGKHKFLYKSINIEGVINDHLTNDVNLIVIDDDVIHKYKGDASEEYYYNTYY